MALAKVSIYSLSTGAVLRNLIIPEDEVALQKQPGEGIYYELLDPDETEIVGGEPTPLPPVDDPTGTDYQPLDENLTALSALTATASRVPYFTGAGPAVMGMLPVGTYGAALLATEDAPSSGPLPYAAIGGVYGLPVTDQWIILHSPPTGTTWTIPAGMSTSSAYATTPATAASSFPVRKNGTQVGTVTFAAGQNWATFSAASAITIVGGTDALRLDPPGTIDTTLADITFTIAGTR